MSQKVEGVFEVVELEDGVLTVRHVATSRDYEIKVTSDGVEGLAKLLPLGTHFVGTMEIEDVHFC